MSKGLEALKELKMWATNSYIACKEKECETIAEPIENELKALEIIMPFVNIDMLMFKGLIEQDEYDLLKSLYVVR